MAEPAQANRLRAPALALLVFYWVALVFGTHWPRVSEVLHIGASDKALHFCAYFGLAVLLGLNWALRGHFGWRQRGLALALIVLFAALDEWTQIPVGRDASVYDWLADGLGAITGLAACVGILAAARQWRDDNQ
ncbi:MAG: VanZ family protein [Pirellulales bacterium]